MIRAIRPSQIHMKFYCFLFALALPLGLFAQQVSDTDFTPSITHTAYESGKGPIVFIDEGHHNFHTKTGRYQAFSHLLERDGYVVEAYSGEFEAARLAAGKVLVISNALNEINVENWYVPTPSAFTEAEIEVLEQWVSDGGSLWLIADHMPMAGAAEALAAAFEFEFSNGFVIHPGFRGPAIFRTTDGSLAENAITQGRNADESVDEIATFTGQAFRIPEAATPILTFNSTYVNLLPDTAWVFTATTSNQPVDGWAQGAYRPYGKGKVAVFGEAAMFTAQLAGPEQQKMGMNDPLASQNYQLLLNVIHWLDGKLGEKREK